MQSLLQQCQSRLQANNAAMTSQIALQKLTRDSRNGRSSRGYSLALQAVTKPENSEVIDDDEAKDIT